MSRSEELGPERTVEVHGATISYRETGEGPPVVFLHGLLVNGDIWRKVAPTVAARGFRSVVPDLPLGAHRLPMPPDSDLSPPGLAALIDGFLAALDLSGVTLVGNDTGGALTQLVVTEHPDRVGRVVLTPCDAFDRFLPPTFRYLQWSARVPGSAWLMGQTLRFGPLQRLPIAFGWLTKRPISADLIRGFARPLLEEPGVRRDLTKVLRGIHPRYTIRAASMFGSVRQPVLLAWAVEDRFFRFEMARTMSTMFPDVRLEPIRDSYTFVQEDQPERLSELIADFAGRPSA
jgi:pimeloyl-ACP methyl ester carboxylesterase